MQPAQRRHRPLLKCAGLFVPSILVGASYGRMVGVFVRWLHPGSAADEGTYALLGSASFMAGSMRLVVSICVMLLELTNQLSLLPLMMIVLVVAKAVGDGTGILGAYAMQLDKKGFPMLRSQTDASLRHCTAGDLIKENGPVMTVPRLVRVDRLVATLRSCNHNGFPVLESAAGGVTPSDDDGENGGSVMLQDDEEQEEPHGKLLGVVLRHHLLVLLRSGRAFQHFPVVTHNSQRIAFMYDITDFDKNVSTESPTIEDVVPLLSSHALGMYIDLGPYLNPASHVVHKSTNARQTYELFKGLGLRHLCVLPDIQCPPLGVITRHDLMPDHVGRVISHRLGEHMEELAPLNRRTHVEEMLQSTAAVHMLGRADNSRVSEVRRPVRPGHVGVRKGKAPV